MKVLLVTAVFPPEPVVSATMGRDLAQELAGRGCVVTVCCPQPSRPMGVEYATFRSNAPLVTTEDGVSVVRLPSFSAPESHLARRARESWSFGWHTCRYLSKARIRPDVMYVNAWPLLGQALLAWYARRARTPMVLQVMDIYPESLLPKLPRFCRGRVASPITALDRWIGRRAARVVVISENMRRTYAESRGLASEKVVTILNWVDETRFAHLPARGEACVRYGVAQEAFTFVYLGNIAPTAGVEHLIEAFHFARLSQAQLVIAGDGSAKAACAARAKSLGSSKVRFISCPDAANVPLLQSLAHVCLLPLRKGAGPNCMPSKLMAYLLSAKPVLATVDLESDTARVIAEAGCGWIEEPEDVAALATKMRDLAVMPLQQLESLGQRGRSYALTHYSKGAGARKLADVVLGVLREQSLPGGRSR